MIIYNNNKNNDNNDNNNYNNKNNSKFINLFKNSI